MRLKVGKKVIEMTLLEFQCMPFVIIICYEKLDGMNCTVVPNSEADI